MQTASETFLLIEQAHMQARAAWLWPDDEEIRGYAATAAAMLGINYHAAVESVVTHQGADENTARREIAERFRRAADRVYAIHGHDPNAAPEFIPEWLLAEADDA